MLRRVEKIFTIFLVALTVSTPVIAKNKMHTDSSISKELAINYFKEINKMVEKDGEKLWGKSLYTPLLFVDPVTKDVVANEIDNKGILNKDGNIFIGKFPENQIIANSVTNLGDKNYAMVRWQDCSGEELSRNVLLIHEMFHYHQSYLGLSNTEGEGNNNHLDEMDARVYLKLEWAALNKAINSTNIEKKEAINDALIFRQLRRDYYNSSNSENLLEIHEGLAEYTGIVCASNSKEDIQNLMNKEYDSLINSDSFIRSFAYYSGPAYGVLIDEVNPNWRSGLKYNSDIGQILKESYHMNISVDTFNEIKDKYGYKGVYSKELLRKQVLEKQLREYENRFENKPIVKIELEEPKIGFNPSNIVPFKDLGTVYPNINITDSFGTLEVTKNGCLLSVDWSNAFISAENIVIESSKISGDGWTLQLSSNFTIVKENENYIIKSK